MKREDMANARTLLEQPFPADAIRWRVGQAGERQGKPWAKLLAYVDARMVMDRLDDVFGFGGWRDEYTAYPAGSGVLCRISVLVDGEWVYREDAAEYASTGGDMDDVKTATSEAFKRAAVKWGVARYLYDAGDTFAQIVDRSAAKSAGRAGGFHNDKKRGVQFHWIAPPEALRKVGHKDVQQAKEAVDHAVRNLGRTGDGESRTEPPGGGNEGVKLPFGKHKGMLLSDPNVPRGYLEWILDNGLSQPKDAEMRRAIKLEVERRLEAKEAEGGDDGGR